MPYRKLCLLVAAALLGPVLLPPESAEGQESNEAEGRQRITRPRHQAPRVEKLPAELERVLKDWETASGKFEKLYGSHYRYVYDSVFQVEKRSMGNFWFEAPDKGRIDIKPRPVTPGTVNPERRGQDGRPYTVKSDAPEQWVSNGTEIQRVNHTDKTVEVFPIPEKLQGKNIVEGPLPFLFGMKAEMAKQRYKLTLGEFHNQRIKVNGVRTLVVHILAQPRLRRDAANWSKAEVLLDAKTFYPAAIKLLDPAGTKETVYSFSKVREPSGLEDFFSGNPFKLYLPGFKRIVRQPQTGQPGNKNLAKMPVVRGRGDWKALTEFFEKHGYTVKVEVGRSAPRQDLEGRIYEQRPEANQLLADGQTIVFTLYGRAAAIDKVLRNALTSSRMPNLLEQNDWQTIQDAFEAYDCKVSFRRGVPAPKEDLVHRVYQQKPEPGAPLQKGQTVTLTLYDKMATDSGSRTERSSAKPAGKSRQ